MPARRQMILKGPTAIGTKFSYLQVYDDRLLFVAGSGGKDCKHVVADEAFCCGALCLV